MDRKLRLACLASALLGLFTFAITLTFLLSTKKAQADPQPGDVCYCQDINNPNPCTGNNHGHFCTGVINAKGVCEFETNTCSGMCDGCNVTVIGPIALCCPAPLPKP